jgi:hypothetical protein
MDRQMPPPPRRPPSLESWEHVIEAPVPGAHRRPAAVTIAGVLLVVAGVFAGFAGLLILTTGDGATIEGVGDGGATLPVAVTMVLACCEIGSGVLVLRGYALGRPLGRHRLAEESRHDRGLRIRGVRARQERRGIPSNSRGVESSPQIAGVAQSGSATDL